MLPLAFTVIFPLHVICLVYLSILYILFPFLWKPAVYSFPFFFLSLFCHSFSFSFILMVFIILCKLVLHRLFSFVSFSSMLLVISPLLPPLSCSTDPILTCHYPYCIASFSFSVSAAPHMSLPLGAFPHSKQHQASPPIHNLKPLY